MKRPLRSIYGQYVATVDDFRSIHSQGLISGKWGNQMPIPDLTNFVVFDDFDGATLLGTWQVAKGTDGADSNFACNGGISGTIQGTTGATTTTMAGSGIQIAAHLNLEAQGAGVTASSNNLEFNTRIQVSAITGLCLFVGFTSQVASLQMPIQGSGVANGLTINNNNAVGFLYDTAMSTTDWWCVGAKGGVAATALDCGSGPAAATYDQLAISIDQLGNANFFRNSGGTILGSVSQQPASGAVTMANAVTVTTPLTPVIAAFSRIAASKNVLVDYIMASMNRI
jgi:hypothetical protein